MAKREKPKATSGSKKLPSLKEDVRSGIKEDVSRMKKAKTTTAKGAAKTAVTSAAKRAGTRMLGRAGAVGAAFSAGHAIGTAINKATGLSNKIADALSPSRSANPNVDVTGKSTRILMSKKKSMETKSKPKKTALQKAQEFVKSGGVFEGATGKKKEVVKPPELTTRKKFSNRFSKARKSGKSEFSFEGKKYNTRLKGEK